MSSEDVLALAVEHQLVEHVRWWAESHDAQSLLEDFLDQWTLEELCPTRGESSDDSDMDVDDTKVDVDLPLTPLVEGDVSAEVVVDVGNAPSTHQPSGSGLPAASITAPAPEKLESGGYKCPYCPKVSVKFANVFQHLPHCRSGPPVPKQKCHLCGKEFTGGGALRNHLNGAGPRKPTCPYRKGIEVATAVSKK